MNPAVSIIVAIYNAEPYLHRCMESLLNQTLHDIEVLLINDGSTDNSGALCDEYAAKDSRIKVFHRTNHGVAATRQFGLEHVTGEYVIHADPDDWLDLDMLEKMYETAKSKKVDVVICDYIMEYGNTSKRIIQELPSLNTSQLVKYFLNHLHGGCCNKLVKTSCIEQYNVNFIEGVDLGEDRVFFLRLLQNPLKVAYCPDTAYHYDQYSNNLSYTRPIVVNGVYQRVLYIQKIREYQTMAFDNYGIPVTEVLTAFLAIRTQAYPPEDFFKVFSHLKETRIFRLPDIPFHMRLIVWTAFHINYRTAERLMA